MTEAERETDTIGRGRGRGRRRRRRRRMRRKRQIRRVELAREWGTDRVRETETMTETKREIQRKRERETRSGSESAAHPRLCGSGGLRVGRDASRFFSIDRWFPWEALITPLNSIFGDQDARLRMFQQTLNSNIYFYFSKPLNP